MPSFIPAAYTSVCSCADLITVQCLQVSMRDYYDVKCLAAAAQVGALALPYSCCLVGHLLCYFASLRLKGKK